MAEDTTNNVPLDEIKGMKRADLEAIAPQYQVDPTDKNVDQLRTAILQVAEARQQQEASTPDDTDEDNAPDENNQGEDSPEESDQDSADEDEDEREGDEPEGDVDQRNEEPIQTQVKDPAELAADLAERPQRNVPNALGPEAGPRGHVRGFDETGQPVFATKKELRREVKGDQQPKDGE